MSKASYPLLRQSEERIALCVECREYTMENSPLFSSVRARGQELLSRPMALVLRANGEEQSVAQIESLPIQNEDGTTTVVSAMQSELFFINTEIRVEDDGCCFVRISLMARGYTVPQIFGIEPKAYSERRVDALYVDIPLRREHSRLYQTVPNFPLYGAFDKALPEELRYADATPEGGLHAPFIPQIYLGSEQAGCGVFFESNEGWTAKDDNRVIEVLDGEDERILRIHLLDGEPEKWRGASADTENNINLAPVDFRFGFMATPVRELPKRMFPERSFHLDCFKKIEGYYEDFLAEPVVAGSSETGYDRLARLGVDVLYLHEKWNDIQNSPMLTERTRRRLARVVDECHRRGIRVIPYFGYEISTLSPDYGSFGCACINGAPEDGVIPSWNRWPSQRALGLCYNHDAYRERFVRGVISILEQFNLDGIYLDSTLSARACRNPLHGCSWTDARGVRHETYPFSAVRKVLRPIYEYVSKRGGIMNLHGYGSMSLSGVAFATSLWEGENFQSLLMKGSLTEMPEQLMRCQFTSRNIGVPVLSLCYSAPPDWTYKSAVSMGLLHDSMPKPVDIGEPLELTSKLWEIYGAFPIEQSEFIPYYENPPASADHPAVKISLYCTADCALAVAASTESGTDDVVSLDFSMLGAYRIENMLTGEQVSGSRTEHHFKAFDFVILRIERQEAERT